MEENRILDFYPVAGCLNIFCPVLLDQLSAQQLHRVALKLDDLKAGGDGAGVVVTVLLIASLVLLLVLRYPHQE
jgi:hypothetical protein